MCIICAMRSAELADDKLKNLYPNSIMKPCGIENQQAVNNQGCLAMEYRIEFEGMLNKLAPSYDKITAFIDLDKEDVEFRD